MYFLIVSILYGIIIKFRYNSLTSIPDWIARLALPEQPRSISAENIAMKGA